MNQPEIEFEHVVKRFGQTTVIPDLSFTINKGEFVTVLGSSGSGKTTTLKMINGLWQPTSGTVKIGGKELTEHNQVDLRRHVGYVVQQIALFPHLTIKQNIAVVPKLLGWEQAKIDQRVDELLDLVKLPSDQYADRYPAQLSGGQQQRVGLARALAANPDFILFDEPLGALDALTRIDLQKEIKNLHASLADKTFFFVTHDINEALYLGQRVMVMNRGRLEQFASPETIVQYPASPFVEELLATEERNQELWRRLQ
ncbi:ABC transporter ATP-binding protein [Limosilactobacillus fermentum]|uniref:ABC transporter ATP-binding protein n=1 Tax=Limosilactobacillus fermentum TaxID=1613 RepID=UPI003B9861FA